MLVLSGSAKVHKTTKRDRRLRRRKAWSSLSSSSSSAAGVDKSKSRCSEARRDRRENRVKKRSLRDQNGNGDWSVPMGPSTASRISFKIRSAPSESPPLLMSFSVDTSVAAAVELKQRASSKNDNNVVVVVVVIVVLSVCGELSLLVVVVDVSDVDSSAAARGTAIGVRGVDTTTEAVFGRGAKAWTDVAARTTMTERRKEVMEMTADSDRVYGEDVVMVSSVTSLCWWMEGNLLLWDLCN